MKRNRKQNLFLLSLIMAVTAGLGGCRPSPALVQKIYTADATEIDYDQQQLDPEDEGQEDEDFNEEQDPDTDKDTETETDDAVHNDDADGTGSSEEVRYSDSGTGNGTADGSVTNGDTSDTGSAKKSDKDSSDKDSDEGKKDSDNPDIIDTTKDDSSDSDKKGSGSGDGDEGDGDDEEDPNAEKKKADDDETDPEEETEEAQYVTATGYAAAMVEMLGGSGRLLTSDSAFTGNSLSQVLFSDVASGEVATSWNGDGSNPMNDSEFELLLSSKPEVCFEISGEDTFTEEQVRELKAAGIQYKALPAPDSSQDLIDAAYIIAEFMDTNQSTGKSSESIAGQYETWIRNMESDVSGGSSTYYSCYIADWLYDISYQFTNGAYYALPAEADQSGSGQGTAIAWSPKKNEVITEFMGDAGVKNESTTAVSTKAVSATDSLYVMPMFHQFYPQFSSEDYTYYSDGIAISLDWFLVHNFGGGTEPVYLGSEEFPAIIVADQDTKTAIESSWYWEYHGVFELENKTIYAGYAATADDGTLAMFNSSIIGNYNIYVNPYGLGDWAEGSVDSPLEAYFVANKFTGAVSDATLKSKIASFYETFFQTSLSDDQIDGILNGR